MMYPCGFSVTITSVFPSSSTVVASEEISLQEADGRMLMCGLHGSFLGCGNASERLLREVPKVIRGDRLELAITASDRPQPESGAGSSSSSTAVAVLEWETWCRWSADPAG